jgi:hypothetical protein
MTPLTTTKFILCWTGHPEGGIRYAKVGSTPVCIKWTRNPIEAVRYTTKEEALGSKFCVFPDMTAVPFEAPRPQVF